MSPIPHRKDPHRHGRSARSAPGIGADVVRCFPAFTSPHRTVVSTRSTRMSLPRPNPRAPSQQLRLPDTARTIVPARLSGESGPDRLLGPRAGEAGALGTQGRERHHRLGRDGAHRACEDPRCRKALCLAGRAKPVRAVRRGATQPRSRGTTGTWATRSRAGLTARRRRPIDGGVPYLVAGPTPGWARCRLRHR